MTDYSDESIEVIAPNLKQRLSGVTATIARLVPLQAHQIGIVATGPGLPGEIPHISLGRVLVLQRKKLRVWHARRNTEMLLGLLLKHILRKRLKLLFTSASQRQHSRYTRWLINQMDAVVVVSQKGQSYLSVPSTVIRHGINTDQFSPPEEVQALRKKLRVPEGLLVGCYGRIRHQKGTDVFVDAMLQVLHENPEAIGIVMGRATEKHQGFEQELKQKVSDAGFARRLLFMPEVPVDEIADWYRVLDLFVAPQRWEGFGLTPLEAMACGVPVVATPVGAFEELIVDGKTGFLIPVGSVEEMADKISHILDNSNNRLTLMRNSRAHVVENFQLAGEAKALNKVYKDLLSHKDNKN